MYSPCIQFPFFFNLEQRDRDCITKSKVKGKEELVLYFQFSFVPVLSFCCFTLNCIRIAFPGILLGFHTGGKEFTLSPNVGKQCAENTFTYVDALAVLDYYFHVN